MENQTSTATPKEINPAGAILSVVFAVALVPITFIEVMFIQITFTGCCGAPTPSTTQSTEAALGTLMAIGIACALGAVALYQGWKAR